MTRRGIYMAGYLIFWLVYFIFFKIVFLMYNSELTAELDFSVIGGIFLYGSRLDLAFAAYIAVLPFLLVTLSSFIKPGKWLSQSLLVYTTVILIFITILSSTDLELFRIWGFRLDATPLMYLNTPGEMLISVGASPILFLVILNTLVNLFFCFAYRYTLHPLVLKFPAPKYYTAPAYLLATLSLIILMRGGFQLAPINHSSVYFSESLYANQAAINVPWNFFHSISKNGSDRNNPYTFVEEPVADSLVNTLYAEKSEAPKQLIKSGQPNVVLIIWESFTAKVAEDLGGIPGVTPQFKSLSGEGMLFTRVFSSGDRSDKGLVSILSGFPAQPATSIVKDPKKTRGLPNLAKTLRNAGYYTSFYYGGELEFANLKTYLLSGGFHKLVGVQDFEEEQLNSKWGAHDHVVLEKLLYDIETEKKREPFFRTIFTLSSHEPFEIPAEPEFPGKDVTNLFLSSLHYTDGAIGQFIKKAKTKPWYDNTLFIIIADHGHTYPGNSQVFETGKFHIPMLWFGGALTKEPAAVTATMSQTDLASTLLGQLGIPAKEFPWSKDIFQPGTSHFAPYFFKDGVGFVTDSSYMSFDNVGKKLIEEQGATDSTHLILSRAYLQKSYGDYLNK